MSFLKNRTAIVSGAAQGLGEAFALRLAQAGADVLAFDIQPKILEVARTIDMDSPGKVIGLIADISKRSEVERIISTVTRELSPASILINNAGVWKETLVDSSWLQALDDWDYLIETNFKGLLMLSRACIPSMKEHKLGDIINISSYYVLPARKSGTNPGNTDLYNASKWGINGFTDAWSKYLRDYNVRVNALCMGATDTAMLRGLTEDGSLPAGLEGKVMQSSEIADLMIELIKDGRTGENIGAWVGEPVRLEEPRPAHKRITG
mgnify:CR=1 FL=1|tara:strand:- start:140 stop:934 length:795 start_codon:yes stop_codon:yes gene_type:complete